MTAFGFPPEPVVDEIELCEYVGSGDLGSRYSPKIVEIMQVAAGRSRATIVDDNREAIAAVRGHIGTRRTWSNPGAPHPETVLVFGDSYGFGDEHYQGLSWFLTQSFREVHFAWVPFGWDPALADEVKARIVVFQTAERSFREFPSARLMSRAVPRRPCSETQDSIRLSCFNR